MSDGDPGHEAGGGVVGEHDGDEDERPDEEAEGEQDPQNEQELDLLLGPDDQEHVD